MKKVLKGMPSFSALGIKNQMLALAVCVGVGMGTISTTHAAPARNVNPPSLKASAPNVYVVKKGDSLWTIAKNTSVSVEKIKQANRNKNLRILQPGQQLTIPKN